MILTMRIFIIILLMLVFQKVKALTVFPDQTSGTDHSTAWVMTNHAIEPASGTRLVAENGRGLPNVRMHPEPRFHISNKYRSDKKEYRSVFSDKIHNRYSCADPVLDLFTGLFEYPGGIWETLGMKPAVMLWTELRE